MNRTSVEVVIVLVVSLKYTPVSRFKDDQMFAYVLTSLFTSLWCASVWEFALHLPPGQSNESMFALRASVSMHEQYLPLHLSGKEEHRAPPPQETRQVAVNRMPVMVAMLQLCLGVNKTGPKGGRMAGDV